MAPYNLTNLSNANSFPGMIQAVNQLSNNVLGLGLVVTIWMFVFLTVQDNARVKGAVAGFVTTIVSAGMLFLGWISSSIMWIVGFIFAASVLILYVNRNN